MTRRTFHLADPAATTALAERVAQAFEPGDTILLSGPIGAGKSHFVRAAIQQVMSRYGPVEDVPSPTYTLVQTYSLPLAEILHADLYRIASEDEVYELGLEDAFGQAICLIEWPEKLGQTRPANALALTFEVAHDAGRLLHVTTPDQAWQGKWRALFSSETVAS